MATMALPLREMSVNVQREAVSAQMAYWSLAEDVAHRRFQLFLWVKTRTLNNSMGRLVEKQQTLIDCLRAAPTSRYTPEVFAKVANDLDNVVSLTNSFIDEAYDMPDTCLSVCTPRLENISELNGYLDNFAESFRIASDAQCTAALAAIARGVMAEEAVSAL